MAFAPALEVTDNEAAKDYLKRGAGCEVVRDWPKDKVLYFKDPSGQMIDIQEAK
jgi:hypothetical protein